MTLMLVAFSTLGADTAVERHALVFRQAAEAIGLDVLEVREDVGAAGIRSDEAEALGIVEPFDYAGLSAHVYSFGKVWDE